MTDTKPKRPSAGILDSGDVIATAVASWANFVIFGDANGAPCSQFDLGCRANTAGNRSQYSTSLSLYLYLECFKTYPAACDLVTARRPHRYGKHHRPQTSFALVTYQPTAMLAVQAH